MYLPASLQPVDLVLGTQLQVALLEGLDRMTPEVPASLDHSVLFVPKKKADAKQYKDKQVKIILPPNPLPDLAVPPGLSGYRATKKSTQIFHISGPNRWETGLREAQPP